MKDTELSVSEALDRGKKEMAPIVPTDRRKELEVYHRNELKAVNGCNRVDRLGLRPQEIAEALGISLPLVYGLIRAKKLPAVKVNNSYICPVTALEKALNELVGEEVTA